MLLLALQLFFLPEHTRPTPAGEVVKADLPAPGPIASLKTARGGYASVHLFTKSAGMIAIRCPFPVEAFREVFRNGYPDELQPVSLPYRAAGAGALWLDIWIPAGAKPGKYTLAANQAALEIQVSEKTYGAGDAISLDHNSYGIAFLSQQYPHITAKDPAAALRLMHAFHRIFFEHRGVFHNLGYGHGGKVAPEYAPALAGEGRARHIANWDMYDRHFGPLLDGSYAKGSRRGEKPIPYVYLPINPEWPAQFVNWGTPGYEKEFTNVVSGMERHFREKGWTKTRFELFFNHKKRYKAFPWDGDEVRFLEDNDYFREYKRLLDASVPRDSPVQFVFRADASWAMEQQFKDLKGVVNFWVCSSGMMSWLPGVPRQLRDRGDIVWHYGSPPAITQPASAITVLVLRTWLWDAGGFVHWLVTSPTADGTTALVYPGPDGPVPSIRLKLQRNALQDLTLLKDKQAATMAFNNTSPADWWNPRPGFADGPPDQVANPDVDAADRPRFPVPDSAAWQRLRETILQ